MQELSDDLSYYAVRVAPMREEHVTRIAENRGIADAAMFMPALVRASRYHKRLVVSDRPALSGYVFLGFREAPNWFEIRSTTRAIVAVVGVRNTPARVVYQQLLRFCAPHLFPERRDTFDDIKRLVSLAAERERQHRHAIAQARLKLRGGFVENATENHAVVRLGMVASPKPEHVQQLDEGRNAA